MTEEAAKPAAAASEAAAKAPGFWAEKVAGRMNVNGFKGAAAKSFEDVKSIVGKGAEGSSRGIGFARVGAVGAGAYIASGVFQGKNADGTDRGALHRLGNLVVGGGMVAGGVLAGRA